MKYKSALFLVFLTLIPGVSWAERPVKFDVGLGLTFGGDELAYATFTDGNTEKVKAGELLHIYGGLLFKIPDSPFSTRFSNWVSF